MDYDCIEEIEKKKKLINKLTNLEDEYTRYKVQLFDLRTTPPYKVNNDILHYYKLLENNINIINKKLQRINTYLKIKCNHKWSYDYIDTPHNYSYKIEYCEKCECNKE